uniref:Uncharacterized protein n=1 Tax=Nelumbo nucifera TaxID=4432 RepID=A0A822ZMN6_NELNU|nr:TPA_asm: hypothetical protein HUJ06_017221 [Nelumbo nucifera]
MSSELFLFDGPFFRSSSSDMVSSDADLQFLLEPFHPFAELPFDILNAFSDDPGLQFLADPSPPAHQSPYDIVSCSPPSQQLDNLSLSPTTSVPSAVESAVGNTPCLFVLDDFGVKAEGDYMNFNNFRIASTFSNGHGTGKGTGMMQRSFSSQSLDRKPSFFQPCFNPLMETPNFQFQPVSSHEKSKTSVPMRRVCSTGDLQRIKGTQPNNQFFSSPLSTENSFTEEAGFKVGRYSAEERKQRIDSMPVERH